MNLIYIYIVRIEHQFHIVPLSISNHFIHFKISAISPFNYERKNKKLSINLYQIAINRPHNYFEYVQQIIHYAQPTILYLYMYGNFLVMLLLSNSAHIANQSSILFLENHINLYWLTWTIKSRNMILKKTKQATFTKTIVNM